MKVLGLLAVVGLIVYAIGSSGDKGSGSSAASSSDSGGTDIILVQAKSACIASGVSDAWTGDGKVLFSFTLRNTGEAGSASVTPVRHYSDGETNESAMDAMDAPVGAYSTERYKSEQLTYKAHEHEIVSCGLRIDGGAEIPIRATHL